MSSEDEDKRRLQDVFIKRNVCWVISKHGADVSIFEKCHHNIIFGRTDIRVPLPPAYVQEVWDCSKANGKNIKKSISSFNWNKAFKNHSIDAKVELLNETLLNIYRNYIPNKKKLSATTVSLRG